MSPKGADEVRCFAASARWLASRLADERIEGITPGERAELVRHRDALRAMGRRLDDLANHGAPLGDADIIHMRAGIRAGKAAP